MESAQPPSSSTGSKVCVVVVFNYSFPRNVPVLRRLYARRFDHVRFLLPFADALEDGVIPVYESSYRFASFFAQGFHHHFRPEFTHYVFVADDMVLNPAFNQTNVAQILGLDHETSFIPTVAPLNSVGLSWPHLTRALRYTYAANTYVDTWRHLPPAAEAKARFAKHHVADVKMHFSQLLESRVRNRFLKTLEFFYAALLLRRSRQAPYPLAMGYSDLMVVSGEAIQKFCHYCGVLSSRSLFAEIAAPTALLLASSRLKTLRDIALKRGDVWSDEEKRELISRYGGKLSTLIDQFPADKLYLHPIKLSQWDAD